VFYFGTDVTECRARCSSHALRAASSPSVSRVEVEVAPVSCRGNRHSPASKNGTTYGSCCLSKHFITFTSHLASLLLWWCLAHFNYDIFLLVCPYNRTLTFFYFFFLMCSSFITPPTNAPIGGNPASFSEGPGFKSYIFSWFSSIPLNARIISK